MKIIIGNYASTADKRNLVLNDVAPATNSGLAFISKVEGLETAPYRNGTGDWSGADGGYISSQLFSARTITISGFYVDKWAGCNFFEGAQGDFDHLARIHIRSRLPIRTKQKMRIFLNSGLTFYTEGYCIGIKMDYVYEGYGEYQISFYCPDPALYLGSTDGTVGSEWNVATLRKHNSTGYVGSVNTGDGIQYAYMEFSASLLGNNKGIVWGTGGRSTPVEYSGDFPYYPQFVVTPKDGERITNPMFYSVTDDKYFGLGYPENKAAKFTVTSVDANGAITGLSITDAGSYDTDYTGAGVATQAYSYAGDENRTEFGVGATLDLTATQSGENWIFSGASSRDPGIHYMVGDIITPKIAGATILELEHGDELVVDMAEHTALLNGESVAYYITTGSEWFPLETEAANNIIFVSADDTDTDSVKIRWRNGFLGI